MVAWLNLTTLVCVKNVVKFIHVKTHAYEIRTKKQFFMKTNMEESLVLAQTFRKLKNGEKIFKRTIHYFFPNDGIKSCLIAYYCKECGESHVAQDLPNR